MLYFSCKLCHGLREKYELSCNIKFSKSLKKVDDRINCLSAPVEQFELSCMISGPPFFFFFFFLMKEGVKYIRKYLDR